MQFSHPKPEKLLKLLNYADEPWNFDEELKCHSQKRVRSTNCQVYQKPPLTIMFTIL